MFPVGTTSSINMFGLSADASLFAIIAGVALTVLGVDIATEWSKERQYKKNCIEEILKSPSSEERDLTLALEYALSLGDHASAAKLTARMAIRLS